MATGTSKGGYDYEFVTPPPKYLQCPVCLLTLRDPHVISCCGNEFCQACIERVQWDGKPCPLCNEFNFTTLLHKKLVREVNALVVRCPQKELGCDWEGELGQVKKHLDGGEGMSEGCGYVLVTCSNGCGVQLLRRQLSNHELKVCPKRPIERQIASLVQKFEAIVADNQLLRQELQEARQCHHAEMLRHQAEMREIQQNYMAELETMKESILELKLTLMETEEEVEQKYASLKINTVPLATPPVNFAVDNFEHLKSTGQRWSSNPFYSHPGGYKMVIHVYPNGYGHAAGTHLSLYVCLLRGEFDDQLQWPFNGEITVEIYNRSQSRWSKQTVIKLNDDKCGVYVICKPQKYRNVKWGYCQYISHEEIQQHYLNSDKTAVSLRVLCIDVQSFLHM